MALLARDMKDIVGKSGAGKVPLSNRDGVSSKDEVSQFLSKVRTSPNPNPQGTRGRLIFALDATASREATWDRACHVQAEMFEVTKSLGGLDVQLIFFRGFGECKSSKWHSDPSELGRVMTGVRCLGGQTQIGKVLSHALKETATKRVGALIFVGDAFEEDIDAVCHKAGELGVHNVPAFMFHEGGDLIARKSFEQIARLTGGAACSFDLSSAERLKELLAAVAVFAAGGRQALLNYGNTSGEAVRLLTNQMRR